MINPPWILWRYLARHFLSWVAAITGFIALVLSIFEGVELFRRTMGKHVPLGTIIQMIFLKMPSLVEQLLPLIVFFAGFLSYRYLNKRLELVCMRAAGVSLFQLVVPALGVTLMLGGLYCFMLNPLSSALYARLERVQDSIFKPNQESLSLLPSGIWFQRYDKGYHYIVHGKRAHKETETLTDVTLYTFQERSGHLLERVDSPYGTLSDGILKLHNATATINCLDNLPSEEEKNPSFSTIFSPDNDEASDPSLTPLVCQPPQHTELKLNLSFKSLEESLASPKTFSLFSLPSFIRSLESMGFSSLKHKAHWYKLLATPLLLLAMTLWGIYFAYPWQRHQKSLVVYGVPAATVFVLFIFSEIFRNLGTSGIMTPGVATLTSVGLILLLGCGLLLRSQDT